MAAWATHGSTLLVLATGLGKTVVFSSVIKAMQPGRAMVLAHTEELIWQAQQKLEAMGLRVEVEMGELKSGNALDGDADVIVSTVQTHNSKWRDGTKRMTKFRPEDFSVLVIDEAHHAAAGSYREIIAHYRQNPNLKVLGVTATPDRADELALGEIFECVAFDYEILDGINDGWLVPIEQQMVHIEGLDFSKVRTTAGDLNGADLAAIMEAEEMLQGVAGSTIKIIGERKTLVFAVTVKQAEVICEIFNRHKKDCARWVSGKTNKDERRETVAAYARGEFQVLCNCNCFSEGFDVPGVEVVVVAKPTKSRSRYAQFVGRGTRALPGIVDGPETSDARRSAISASAKPSMLVIDFYGNAGRHKLISAADILGGKSSEDAKIRATKKAQQDGIPVNVIDQLRFEEEKLAEEKEERRKLEAARKARIVADVKYNVTAVDPFDRYQVRRQPPSSWEHRNGISLSEKQRAALQRMGVNPSEISVSCGRKLLGARFNGPCSEKQAAVLRKHGYAAECSMKEAGRIIDALAANGWRRPAEPEPESVNDSQPEYA
jgi:superfamily II DNA or RNA helicase